MKIADGTLGLLDSVRATSRGRQARQRAKRPEKTMDMVQGPSKRAQVQILKGTPYFEGYVDGATPYTNPSDLVGKHGLKVWREMMERDDMVGTAYAYIAYATLSTDWDLEMPKDPDAEDKRAAQFVRDALPAMQGSVTQMLLGILDAHPMGFSVGEKIWSDVLTEGEWAGKQPIDKVAHRNPVYLEFKMDEFGNIEPDGIWQENFRGTGGPYTHIDVEDVVYHVPDHRDENPYGNTKSRAGYRYYFKKDGALRLWARDMERFGSPLVIGRRPATAIDTDIDDFRKYLRELRDSLVAVLKKDWEVELIERKVGATRVFNDSIKTCNRGIGRALGLPALVLESTDTGAYALGKEHTDQFTWLLLVIRDALEEVVNTQLIEPMVFHNFAVRRAPRWYLKPFGREDMQAKSEVAKVVAELGLPLSIAWLRETFGMPQPQDDDDTLIGRPQVPALVRPDGSRPSDASAEMIARDYSEMIWDAAHGQLAPQRTLTFGEPAVARRPLTPLETHFDFDEINSQDKEGEDVSAGNMGLILETIAKDVETSYASGEARRGRLKK